MDLLVRGTCCLKPGIKGISENVRVVSIVGRYLEHSRLYYFYNNGAEEIYLGSADLMPRNLDQRVEVVFPVEDKRHIRYLREKMLQAYLHDNRRARVMQADGSYRRLQPPSEEKAVDAQELLMKNTRGKDPKELFLLPVHTLPSLIEL